MQWLVPLAACVLLALHVATAMPVNGSESQGEGLWLGRSLLAVQPDEPNHSESYLFAMVKRRIHEQNKGLIAFKNTDKYPGVLEQMDDSTIVIVVMVHARHDYLKNFLDSLKEV